MFGMGMGELVVILIVALLVLGPDKIPDAAKAIGKTMRELRKQTPPPVLAARWHATLAHAIRSASRWAEARTVVLTGGCFQNRRLLDESVALLEADGREVLVHRDVPPNDGGLALGQAAIATARRNAGCA